METARGEQQGPESGIALIEVALMLPMLILLMLGVADCAYLLQEDLRVMDSARSAATAATTLQYANNLSYVMAVATASAGNIPGYAVTATQYCLCGPGSTQSSCSGHTACGTYGIPNQYVQVTATATLPVLFSVRGLPGSLHVQSTAIARTPWTGTY